jgi:two-component system sensor histidine kinase BaeS
MFKSLRSRLILSHMLPLLIIVPLIGVLLTYIFENNALLPGLSRELTASATLLANLGSSQPQIWEDPEQARAFINQVSSSGSARLMLLDPQGRLLASSETGDASRIANILDVPGVSDALAGKVIQKINFSQQYQAEMIDVFAPALGQNQRVIGVVRMSYRFSTVAEQIFQLRFIIAAIIGLGLVLGTTLGYLLAVNIGGSIGEVTRAVYRIASENRHEKLEEKGAEEIQLLLRSVNNLVDHLHELEQARRQLLANLVHELGRPMGALRAGMYALKKGAKRDPKLLDEMIDGMDIEMNILQRLLDDLSQLHDQILGAVELEIETIPLSGWLSELLLPWQEAAKQKSLKWEMHIPDGTPGDPHGDLPAIQADPLRLSQIIGNLVDNAIKYTPPYGTITISAGSAQDKIWVKVSDSGSGIPYAEQEKIFTPLFRGEQGRRIKQGMGLGLTIAKSLTTAHGGTLEVESKPGLGSTFILTLPKDKKV